MAEMNQRKIQNQERIFQLFRRGQELTRQEIAAQLELSMPTALQHVTELLEAGIIQECGSTGPTGGRKAKKLRLNPTAGLGIGINIALHHVELAATDLLGELLCAEVLPIPFQDQLPWYQALSSGLEAFVEKYQLPREKIMGVGISFPGIVDEEGNMVARSHVLGISHMGLERFIRQIPYPLVVANDANCACYAEYSPERESFEYLSLNESVGGAFMVGQKLSVGRRCQAGEVGHVLLFPGGKSCYCGKRGCADAYLSVNALTGEKKTLEGFFQALEDGDLEAQKRWDEYLEHLAILVTNLRMVNDLELVIGGEVGSHIEPYLEALCRKAEQYDLFTKDVDYLRPCRRKKLACPTGAAMLALDRYACRLLEELAPSSR